ncbi:hypothetical protein YQE_07100, partial [Dendroctonus ponderosae]
MCLDHALIFQEGKLGDLSPLFLAAEMGHAECLKVMLEKKTVDCNQLRKSENGNTALHIAAEHGHSECIKVLLHNGSDPNLRNLRHQSPLHLAVKANSYASVIVLVRHGNAGLNIEDYNRRTPLHEAVELVADSRKEIVQFLIERFDHNCGGHYQKEEVTACAPKHLKPRPLPTHELTQPGCINTTGDPVVEPVLVSKPL